MLNIPSIFGSGTRIKGSSGTYLDSKSGSFPFTSVTSSFAPTITLAVGTTPSGSYLNILDLSTATEYEWASVSNVGIEDKMVLDIGVSCKVRTIILSLSSECNGAGVSSHTLYLESSLDNNTWEQIDTEALASSNGSVLYHTLSATNKTLRYLRVRRTSAISSGSPPIVVNFFSMVVCI